MKNLKVEAAVLDLRHLSEETLASYEKIEMEAALVLTGPDTEALLAKHSVELSAAMTQRCDADGNVLYGMDFRVEPMKRDLRHVIVMTCDMYSYYSRAILGSFFDLLAGKVGVEELSGPLGTVSAVNQAVHYGWREVLSLLALLTINVGIFNLLPIPALDGCKLLFLAWEGLTGHPVPPRVQGVINTAGTVALVWLMILVTMHDISRFL